MKRILSVFLILLFIFALAGCENDSSNSTKNYPKPVIVMPDEDTAYNINGYKDTTPTVSSSEASNSSVDADSSESQADTSYEGKYFGNKNSKKFHKSDCRYAKNMKEENLMIFETVLEANIAGYSPCSVCSP